MNLGYCLSRGKSGCANRASCLPGSYLWRSAVGTCIASPRSRTSRSSSSKDWTYSALYRRLNDILDSSLQRYGPLRYSPHGVPLDSYPTSFPFFQTWTISRSVDFPRPPQSPPIWSSFQFPHRGCEGDWWFLRFMRSKLGRTSWPRTVACDSMTWTFATLQIVHRSFWRLVPKPWKRYDSSQSTRLVSTLGRVYSRSPADDKQCVPLSRRSPTSIYHDSRSFDLYISRFARSLWDGTAMLAMPSWRSSRPSHPRRSLRLLSSSRAKTYLPYSRAFRSSTRCVR